MTQQHPQPANDSARGGHSTRGRALFTTVVGACTLLLCAGAVVAPSAFVVEGPGPAVNTLGDDPHGGDPVIKVDGRTTYPSTSTLDLTTVSVAGGPGRSINGTQTLWAWLNGDEDIKPREYVYPAGTTSQQQDAQNAADMTNSQQVAVAAALNELDIDYASQPVVAGFATKTNRGTLKAGDVITKIEGKPVTNYEQVPDTVKASSANTLRLTVKRGGKPVAVDAKVETLSPDAKGASQRSLGIFIAANYDFPFKVSFGLQDIGGPSAGTMMALGLIDKLTEGSLAGKTHVAGTGTITADGKIGAIGGIAQKVAGARQQGATVFLAPGANCNELRGRVPKGIQVYSVDTLHDAKEILQDLKTTTGRKSAKASLVGDQRCG